MQEEKGCFPFSVIDFLGSSVTGPALFIYDTVSNLDCISWAKVLVSLLWLFVLVLRIITKKGKKTMENTPDESSSKHTKIGWKSQKKIANQITVKLLFKIY